MHVPDGRREVLQEWADAVQERGAVAESAPIFPKGVAALGDGSFTVRATTASAPTTNAVTTRGDDRFNPSVSG